MTLLGKLARIPRIMRSALSIVVILLSLGLVHCTGAECAATSTFIADIDSDCVDDASDNCIGWYNPLQEDADDDDFGDACDSAPNDSGAVGLTRQTDLSSYNLAGYYEADDATCDDFQDFAISQQHSDVSAEDGFELPFTGQILKVNLEKGVKSSLISDDQVCVLTYKPITSEFDLKCFDKATETSCFYKGQKSITDTSTVLK